MASDAMGIGDFLVGVELIECAPQEVLEARVVEVARSQDAVPVRLVHVGCGGFVINGICVVCGKFV